MNISRRNGGHLESIIAGQFLIKNSRFLLKGRTSGGGCAARHRFGIGHEVYEVLAWFDGQELVRI